ncbi:hypothetical protein P9139_01510 [Curtobacterium flaccumfaciens]|nr:hypothetical protein P9139_01510 [Curtobacterium flaccumfaciens]
MLQLGGDRPGGVHGSGRSRAEADGPADLVQVVLGAEALELLRARPAFARASAYRPVWARSWVMVTATVPIVHASAVRPASVCARVAYRSAASNSPSFSARGALSMLAVPATPSSGSSRRRSSSAAPAAGRPSVRSRAACASSTGKPVVPTRRSRRSVEIAHAAVRRSSNAEDAPATTRPTCTAARSSRAGGADRSTSTTSAPIAVTSPCAPRSVQYAPRAAKTCAVAEASSARSAQRSNVTRLSASRWTSRNRRSCSGPVMVNRFRSAAKSRPHRIIAVRTVAVAPRSSSRAAPNSRTVSSRR